MKTRQERLLARARDIEDKLDRLSSDLSGLNKNHAKIALEHVRKLRERLEGK